MAKPWNSKASVPSENWDADFLFQLPPRTTNDSRRPSATSARLTSSAPNSSFNRNDQTTPGSPALSFADSALWDDEEPLGEDTGRPSQKLGGAVLGGKESVRGLGGKRIVSDQAGETAKSTKQSPRPELPVSTSLPSRMPQTSPLLSPTRQSSTSTGSSTSRPSSENDETHAFALGSTPRAGQAKQGHAPHQSTGNGGGAGKRLRKKSRPDPLGGQMVGLGFELAPNDRRGLGLMAPPLMTAPLPTATSGKPRGSGHVKKNSLTGRSTNVPFSETLRQEEPSYPSSPTKATFGEPTLLSRMSRGLKRLSSASGFSPQSSYSPPPLPPITSHLHNPSLSQADQASSRTIRPKAHNRQSSTRPPSSLKSSTSPPRPVPTRTSSHYSSSYDSPTDRLPEHTVLSGSPVASAEDIDGLPTSPRRLATSPSITSLGFHLPSPSPASPYHPSQAGKFGSQGSLSGVMQASGQDEGLGSRQASRTPRGSTANLNAKQQNWAAEEDPMDRTYQGATARSYDAPAHGLSPDLRPNQAVAKSLQTFKFGAPRPSATTADPPAKHDGRKDLSLSRRPSGDQVGQSAMEQEKKKSTLKRLSSLSKKHGRKVSDGWRYVSGGSQPASDSAKSSKSSQDSQAPRTPKAKHPHMMLPPVKASPTPSELLFPPGQGGSQRLSVGPRSSSHNGATTTPDRNSIRETDSPGSVAGRRSSMYDLRIPDRVVSAQRGVKEGISQVKEFAAGIHELQALLQQRALLEISLIKTPDEDMTEPETPFQPTHDRRATSPISRDLRRLQEEYAQWWEMAVVLIELGKTGETEDQQERTPEENKRGRRITLAASPESVKSSFDGEGHLSPPMASAPEHWRASTGRHDLSQRQLNVLKEMLASPDTGSPVRPEPQTPTSTKSPRMNPPSPETRTTLPTHPSEIPLPAPQGTFHKGHAQDPRRRQSRSGFFGLKDLWKGSQTESKGGNGDEVGDGWDQHDLSTSAYAKRPVRTPRRPSLASIFRKASSSLGSTTTDSRKSSGQSQLTALTSSPSAGSVRSSLSDWDSVETPGRMDSPHMGSPSSAVGFGRKSSFSFNRTPTNSRPDLKRKASASKKLGVGMPYDATLRKSSANFHPPPPLPPWESEPPSLEQSEFDSAPVKLPDDVLALTPETLPGLLKYLQAVAGRCKDNLSELEGIRNTLQSGR